MTRLLYIDEDPSEQLAVLLRADRDDAVTTRERGHKGRTDPWQLAFAARQQRIFVTCNFKDFEMLHEAWLSWSHEWGIRGSVAHPGILILPNGRELLVDQMQSIVRELMDREASLHNRFFRWRRLTGWQDLSIPDQ